MQIHLQMDASSVHLLYIQALPGDCAGGFWVPAGCGAEQPPHLSLQPRHSWEGIARLDRSRISLVLVSQ